jgi:hypothetical protein
MDRRTLRHYLAQADDQIDHATERLERQARIIEQLKSAGHDSTGAEELMAHFEWTFGGIRAERRAIIDLLHALKGHRRKGEKPVVVPAHTSTEGHDPIPF